MDVSELDNKKDSAVSSEISMLCPSDGGNNREVLKKKSIKS